MKTAGRVTVRLIVSLLALATVTAAGCHRGDTVDSPSTPASVPSNASPASNSVSPAPVAPPPPSLVTEAPTAAGPVPGMTLAELGEPCADSVHFIFATSSTGHTLACRGQPGRYELSAPLIGVRTPGTPCSEDGLAQSPDGSPVMCIVISGERTWRVYPD